jgi:hypothetical protein
MTVASLLALASMPRCELEAIVERIERIERTERAERIERVRRVPRDTFRRRRGRPWSVSLRHRILITCVALRTNLTFRELAACASIPLSTAHRIVAALTPKLANLLGPPPRDRRVLWVVDGTLIPTRDHTCAARSKNYRYSCNAQILIRQHDLRVIATAAGGPGNRNDPTHYRSSRIEPLCRAHRRVLADGGYRGIRELVTPVFRGRSIVRDDAWRRHCRRRARVEHAIGRLKTWRVLRDHRRRGRHLDDTVRAVAFLHNLRLTELRNNP